jgi:hypothetical protein
VPYIPHLLISRPNTKFAPIRFPPLFSSRGCERKSPWRGDAAFALRLIQGQLGEIAHVIVLPVQNFDELGVTIAGTRPMDDSYQVHGLHDVKLDSFAVEHDFALSRHVK